MDTILNDFLSVKVKDVETQFKKIGEKGIKEEFENLPSVPDGHVQGYTQCEVNGKLRYIFSHNGAVIMASALKSTVGARKITEKDWSHAGGIQTIGKYLFVPYEKGEKGMVVIYDLEKFDANKESKVHSINFEDHRAACLGITDFQIKGKNYYLLIIGVDEVYYGYIASVPTEMNKIDFSRIGRFSLTNFPEGGYDKIRCQGFGLVTEDWKIDKAEGSMDDIYMLAPVTHDYGGSKKVFDSSNKDYVYLIRIVLSYDLTGIRYSYLKGDYRHLKNKGGAAGLFGTHFVYGAGIRIMPNGDLVILATSPYIENGELHTNYWK